MLDFRYRHQVVGGRTFESAALRRAVEVPQPVIAAAAGADEEESPVLEQHEIAVVHVRVGDRGPGGTSVVKDAGACFDRPHIALVLCVDLVDVAHVRELSGI